MQEHHFAYPNYLENEIVFNTKERGDDLFSHRRRRIKFSEPSIKKNWDEENACLKKGRGFFSDAELTFCATLFKNHPLGKIAGSLQRR
jgi:hypothetical protein